MALWDRFSQQDTQVREFEYNTKDEDLSYLDMINIDVINRCWAINWNHGMALALERNII